MTNKINLKDLSVVTALDVPNEIKENKDKTADDYVTTSMGAFGLWQLIYVLIAASTRIICSMNTASVVFLAPETEFICKKFSDNSTVEVKNNTCYDNCLEYEYSTKLFEHTLISEFGLICKNKWLQSLTQTILMLGVLGGVSLFGWFSDRFGRSKALVISGITCAVIMFVTPFCPNFWSVAVCRFFAGLGTGGFYALTAVYASELVGVRMIDIIICSCLQPFDGIGLPIQAIFAYLSSTWRTYMFICSALTILIVSITLFLPETPRWYVAKGKTIETIELMSRAAKFNKLDTTHISSNVTNAINKLNIKEKKDTNQTYLDLFRTKKLAIWTVASFSIWFVTGFSFFGLLQHISSFGSNKYVVVAVLGIVQIIAAPLSVLLVKFCGRKVSSILIYSTIGVLSLGLVFTTQKSAAAVTLGALGVTAASISFLLVYIIVIELYPTTMRNMGLGLSSVGSKIGAMVAPFVVNMKTTWIASSIFAAIGFSAVLFCFILPETKGKKLKDTVDDVEQ